MKNWEQEKAYTARRADELRQQMEQAITDKDGTKFQKAFEASARYMKKAERHELMIKYIETTI